MEIIEDDEILKIILKEKNYEKGFSLLVKKYKERLYFQVRRMVLLHDDADDIIQNTFLKVFKGIDKFEGNSQLFTWLYKIATNETLTFIEKNKKRRSLGLEDEELALSNKLAADPYFDGSNIEIKLEKALMKLPEKQKLVFQLRYYEEISYKDISAILGTSEGALKASYHHAVSKIENYFLNHE